MWNADQNGGDSLPYYTVNNISKFCAFNHEGPTFSESAMMRMRLTIGGIHVCPVFDKFGNILHYNIRMFSQQLKALIISALWHFHDTFLFQVIFKQGNKIPRTCHSIPE